MQVGRSGGGCGLSRRAKTVKVVLLVFGKFGVRPIGHVAAGFGNNNLSRNEPTVRGTRIKDHGIRFSRLAGSAILGGLLVFLKVMIMRALIMRWMKALLYLIG